MPETFEHTRIKEIVSLKLKKWLGVSVEEYPSSGHELDVFSASIEGVAVYFEVIWSESRAHVFSDLLMLQQADAEVKLVIASPRVLQNPAYRREFAKVVVSQRRAGIFVHGDMLDGERILTDEAYLETEVKSAVLALVERSNGTIRLPEKSSRTPIAERSRPDKVQEELLSNLHPITKLPSRIFSAETLFRYPIDIIVDVGDNGATIPFIMREGRIFSFHDMGLPGSPFRRVITGPVDSRETSHWVVRSEKHSWLVDLLNQSLKKYARRHLLLLQREKRMQFFFSAKENEDHVVFWQPNKRLVKRTVAKAIRRPNGAVNFWAHNAATLNFMTIGDGLYLKIEPSFVFTTDGIRPVTTRRIGPLTTRWMRREYNVGYLDHVRFWVSFLARRLNTINIPTGGDPIHVSTDTAFTQLTSGILNDARNIEQMFESVDESASDVDSDSGIDED